MSGLFKPILIGFGLISSALVVLIIGRLGILREVGLVGALRVGRLARYVAWLTVEIAKADWMIAKAILTDGENNQRFITVPASQKSDVAKMVFANSITITPGTVTVETEEDHFLIHALTDEAADRQALAHLGEKVCGLERGGAKRG